MTEATAASETGATTEVVVDSAVAATTEGAATETAVTTESVSTEAAGADTGVTAKPTRPEGIPDNLWNDDTGLIPGEVANLLRQIEAAKADVPETADGYELKISDAVTVPEGIDGFELDPKDPMFVEVAQAAKEFNVPRAAFQKMVDAFAKDALIQREASQKIQAAEYAAQGANGPARRETAKAWISANLAGAQAARFENLLHSSDGLAAVETVIALRAGPTPAPNGETTTGAKKTRAQIMYGEL